MIPAEFIPCLVTFASWPLYLALWPLLHDLYNIILPCELCFMTLITLWPLPHNLHTLPRDLDAGLLWHFATLPRYLDTCVTYFPHNLFALPHDLDACVVYCQVPFDVTLISTLCIGSWSWCMCCILPSALWPDLDCLNVFHFATCDLNALHMALMHVLHTAKWPLSHDLDACVTYWQVTFVSWPWCMCSILPSDLCLMNFMHVLHTANWSLSQIFFNEIVANWRRTAYQDPGSEELPC